MISCTYSIEVNSRAQIMESLLNIKFRFLEQIQNNIIKSSLSCNVESPFEGLLKVAAAGTGDTPASHPLLEVQDIFFIKS